MRQRIPAPQRWLLLFALLCGPPAPAGASGEPCASKLRAAVDVGHSKSRPGARSATGKWEHDFNRRFAEELVAQAGSWPDLDLLVLTGDKLSLRERPQQAAQRGAELLLSIHHDSVQPKYMQPWQHEGRKLEHSDAFRGYSLFVSEDGAHSADSLAAATLIGRQLRQAGFAPTLHHAEPIPGENRKLLDRKLGVYAAPFAVLRLATMPSVLLEVGVIVHREEEKDLETPEVRANMQRQVLGALRAYCRRGAQRQKQASP
jgi:N-acetylmuramoyl-L-alanine amidase